MARALRTLLGLVAGYCLGAAIGLAAVYLLSANRHDLSVEAVMTAAFVAGPLGAVIGAIVGTISRRADKPSS